MKNELSLFVYGTPFDESTVMAVIKVESGFNENAVSNKGAKGLMQIMSDTFTFVSDKYGLNYSKEDVFDREKNIRAGILYLDYLFDKYGDITVSLCAYNAGEGNVSAWLKDKRYSLNGKTLDYIPFDETRAYISKINFYRKVYSVL